MERRTKSLGRLRLEVITDTTGDMLYGFIKANVEPGSTIISDARGGYHGLEPEIYTHLPVSQAAQKRAGVDRVISNLKTWPRVAHQL